MKQTLTTKLITIALILSGLVFSGCAKKQDKQRVNGAGRGTTATATAGGAVPAGSASTNYKKGVWGEVYRAEDATQDDFQIEVGNLVSASIDPEAIGTVSGTPGDTTGIRFNGIIVVKNGTVDKAKSQLRLAIWDSFAGTKDGSNTIPEYPIYFDKLTDYVFKNNNTEIGLKFEDAYGYVIMEGVTRGSLFEGEIRFKNHKSYDGSSPDETEHLLGRFAVELNGFFDMQK
ncbi:MAG: hypothetical protein AB7H97_00890 [Pseudobdellovibrionaceae bacterium]